MVSGMTRSTIFISHANPEDNEFVRWLASKLTLAGYVVWCDLDRLKGGDLFWNEVESCLRNDAIRLVAVVSEASYSKDGVRNEWDLGITLEKQIPGFVVPVRIDAFDFSRLPITIHRKHVIDFHRGWHDGLASCSTRLSKIVFHEKVMWTRQRPAIGFRTRPPTQSHG